MMAKHPVPVLATLGGLLGFQVLLDSFLFFSVICSLFQSLPKSNVLCLSFHIIEIDYLGLFEKLFAIMQTQFSQELELGNQFDF